MWDHYYSSNLTLCVFGILAASCLSIENIALEVDGTKGTTGDITRSSTTLRHITVADNNLESEGVHNVASFLHRLSSVEDFTVTGTSPRWRDVRTALSLLRQTKASAEIASELCTAREDTGHRN